MENLNIEKRTGAYGDYTFVGCDIPFQIKIAGKEYFGSFQTGHGYDHNDYNYPTNAVSVYDDNDVLQAIEASEGDYDDFLWRSDVEIPKPDFEAAYKALIKLRDSAQVEVDQILKKME